MSITRRAAVGMLASSCLLPAAAQQARAEGEWEISPESPRALRLGLEWLHRNQGPKGNWGSNDLGLVGMGVLAFLADGHTPGRGRYGDTVERALDYVLKNAKPSGLLNISSESRDMYNHGLSTFVLGQAHGMTNDQRINKVLDRSLKLICNAQCEDGGWDYKARRQRNGHDLSLAVMQAKALRSAVDSGLDVPPEVVEMAISSVRKHYCPSNGRRTAPESEQQKLPGQFTYSRGGGSATPAMAAAGVVCLQEFGQYDDWRIPKNMEFIRAQIVQKKKPPSSRNGQLPFDAYTMYYVGQAIYQVGGDVWRQNYPILRDYLIATQVHSADDPRRHGKWVAGGHVSGGPGDLYGTSVACFVLAMPNRYLPILQEGKIESLRQRFQLQ